MGPWYQDTVATLAALLRLSGEEAEARALVERLGSGEGVGDCRARAVYHILCGEIDAAADWTEKAIAERDPGMMFYLRFTLFRPLRASRRWPRIAGLLNLPAAASPPGEAHPDRRGGTAPPRSGRRLRSAEPGWRYRSTHSGRSPRFTPRSTR